jgi:hypothetical protein
MKTSGKRWIIWVKTWENEAKATFYQNNVHYVEVPTPTPLTRRPDHKRALKSNSPTLPPGGIMADQRISWGILYIRPNERYSFLFRVSE